MTPLNAETAAAYVAGVETEWYGAPLPVLHTIAFVQDGITMVTVRTTQNSWDVWVEGGALYGEC